MKLSKISHNVIDHRTICPLCKSVFLDADALFDWMFWNLTLDERKYFVEHPDKFKNKIICCGCYKAIRDDKLEERLKRCQKKEIISDQR